MSVAWALWPRQRVFSVARPESRYSWQHLRCFPRFLKWHTLPETNISPENRPLKRRCLLESIIFRGYVSFREGISHFSFTLDFFSWKWRLPLFAMVSPTCKRFTRVRQIAHLDAKALESNAYHSVERSKHPRQDWVVTITEWEKKTFEASGCSGLSGALFCQKCERSQLSLSTVLKPTYLSKLSKNGGKQIYSVFTFVNPIWIPTNLESIKDYNQFVFEWETPRWKAQSLAGKQWSTSPGRSTSWHVTILLVLACHGLLWLSDSLHLKVQKEETTPPNPSNIKSNHIKLHQFKYIIYIYMYQFPIVFTDQDLLHKNSLDGQSRPPKVMGITPTADHCLFAPHSATIYKPLNQHSHYKYPQPQQPWTNWAIKDSKLLPTWN